MEWFRAYVEKSYHQIRRANWQLDFFSMWKRCLEGEKEKQYDFKVEFTYVYYKLTMKK